MSVRKAFIWSFGGQLISFVATFATTVILARLLSPREVGIYAIGLAVVGVLQAISAFGVGTFVVRARALSADLTATAFTLNAIIGFLLAGAVFVSSLLDAVTLGEPMVARVLHLLAIIPVIGVFEFLPATLLQREMRFGAISVVTILRTVASAAASILAALLGASSLSAAWGGLAFAVVGVLGMNLAYRSQPVPRLSDIVLGRMLGLLALGFYSRASALSNILFQNVYGSAARVLLVKLADDHRADRPLRSSYLHALDLILGIMWPLLAGIAVLAGPLVALLFGERWLPAATPLAILMAVQALALSFSMNHELFVLRDRVGEQAWMEGTRSVIGLGAFAWGATFGLAGAAAGRLVDSLIGMVLYLPRLPQLAGVTAGELVRLYARNLLLTAVAALPAGLVMARADFDPLTSRAVLAAAIAAGGILWAVALAGLRHPLYGEARRWWIGRRTGRG